MICVAFNNFLSMFLSSLLKIITFSVTTCVFGDIVWNLMRARREEGCLRINCFDVRRWKARSGKRTNSENQKGDVPRNYIRFGRGDVVEWKEAVDGSVFARFKRVAGSTIASCNAWKKSTRGD